MTEEEKVLEIPVEVPMYKWKAIYKDGSFLMEYEEDGTQHLLREIDEDNLAIFEISDGIKFHAVNVTNGEFIINAMKIISNSLPANAEKYSLIWFKRHQRVMNLDEELSHKVQYVLGVQTNVDEKNYQQLIWICEDGTVRINGTK